MKKGVFMENQKFNFKFLNLIMYVFFVVALFYVLKNLGIWDKIVNILVSLIPVYIGIIICWISLPLAKRLRKLGLKDGSSSVISLLIIFGIFALILSLVIPILVKEIANLVSDLPSIYNNVTTNINEILKTKFSFPDERLLNVSANETSMNFLNKYLNDILGYSITTLQSTFNVLIGIFTVVVISFFLVKDIDKFKAKFINFLSKGKKDTKRYEMIMEIDDVLMSYVKGIILDSFIVGVLMTILCFILGIKYAIIFGVLIMILNLIPYIGALLSELIVALFALSTGGIGFAILTLALAVLIQIIDSNILQPNIVAKSVKLHPVVVFAGLIIFNMLLGIFGMIIAVPVIAILKIILTYKIEEKNINNDDFFKRHKVEKL